MAITIDGLTSALTVAIKGDGLMLEKCGWFAENINNFKWTPYPLIAAYGSAVSPTELYQGDFSTHNGAAKSFSAPEQDTGSSEPAVRSHLNASAVLPITKTGIVKNIAFGVGRHNSTVPASDSAKGSGFQGLNAGGTFYNNGSGIHATTIPTTVKDTDTEKIESGDMFMVITLDPGIQVTNGGYLTVKGFVSGDSNTKNNTYITLKSGV